MTLPFERTRSVLETQKFLRRLIDPKVTPGLPKYIREDARALLRHYPTLHDMEVTAMGWGDKLVGFVAECPFGKPKAPWIE